MMNTAAHIVRARLVAVKQTVAVATVTACDQATISAKHRLLVNRCSAAIH